MEKILENLDYDLDYDLKEPDMYNVIIRNNDITPAIVIDIALVNFFDKTPAQARAIRTAIEKEQIMNLGTYFEDIAKLKVEQVKQLEAILVEEESERVLVIEAKKA